MLKKLLIFDPAVRISVQSALDHEYLNWPKARIGFQGAHSLEAPAPHVLNMIDIENAPSTQSSLLDLMMNEAAQFEGR